MAVSDILGKFRKSGPPEEKPEEKGKDQAGPRIFKLTDEEVKELQGYQQGEGMEQQCLVTGRLGENGEFSVTSVHSQGGQGPDENEMAKQMMGSLGGPPLGQ